MDFSTPSPRLCSARPHVLTIKELGHCASKFEQTNSHVEIVHPNKLQTPLCYPQLFIYAVCEQFVARKFRLGGAKGIGPNEFPRQDEGRNIHPARLLSFSEGCSVLAPHAFNS